MTTNNPEDTQEDIDRAVAMMLPIVSWIVDAGPSKAAARAHVVWHYIEPLLHSQGKAATESGCSVSTINRELTIFEETFDVQSLARVARHARRSKRRANKGNAKWIP